jgi:hypothetical protein
VGAGQRRRARGRLRRPRGAAGPAGARRQPGARAGGPGLRRKPGRADRAAERGQRPVAEPARRGPPGAVEREAGPALRDVCSARALWAGAASGRARWRTNTATASSRTTRSPGGSTRERPRAIASELRGARRPTRRRVDARGGASLACLAPGLAARLRRRGQSAEARGADTARAPKSCVDHVAAPRRGALATALEVPVLDRDDSVYLLRRRTGEVDVGGVSLLTRVLGDLPLALEQAASYMDATGRLTAKYLEVYEREGPASGLRRVARRAPALALQLSDARIRRARRRAAASTHPVAGRVRSRDTRARVGRCCRRGRSTSSSITRRECGCGHVFADSDRD